MNRFRKAFLLARELGFSQLAPYATYQMRLRSGAIRRETPARGWKDEIPTFRSRDFQIPLPVVSRYQVKATGIDTGALIGEAESILQGRYRPFGGDPQPLAFDLGQSPLEHWTHYGSVFAGKDIKLTWEPARFTWAYPLIEAYVLTDDERFSEFFWQRFEEFVGTNPVNLGPNWASAQEAALRVLPLLFALKTFKSSPSASDSRMRSLISLLYRSALRILPTLDYARSQNNNHLLSESLGLIMLGTFFSGAHPAARKWLTKGFAAFEHGLQTQIENDGTYSQHSMIYHRMMLQLALIYCGYAQENRRPFLIENRALLCAATQWLAGQVDAATGDAPNLGHNDGTQLLPFGAAGYRDFRPTLQAAGLAFIGRPAFDAGPWDDLPLWLGLPSPDCQPKSSACSSSPNPVIHRVGNQACWGTLRAVNFHSRPAHADQLDVDLWWHGHNIALDAGTYQYNGEPPWDNPFAATCVHNTVTFNGEDQMERVSRFLWLGRADAKVHSQLNPNAVTGKMKVHSDPPIRHTRTLAFLPDKGFTVSDEILPIHKGKPYTADLQWLLPDWSYTLLDHGILLEGEEITIELTIECSHHHHSAQHRAISLIRGGATVAGDIESPIRGWFSPTYNQKKPALSFVFRVSASGEVTLTSHWSISTRASNSR